MKRKHLSLRQCDTSIYPLTDEHCVPDIYGSEVNGYTYYTIGNITAFLSMILAVLSGVFGFINAIYTTNLAPDANKCWAREAISESDYQELADRITALEEKLNEQLIIQENSRFISLEELTLIYQDLSQIKEKLK